ELVDLMLDEIDRMERVVDTYGKLARVEVVRAALDVNDLVRAVARAHALAPASRVSLRTELADELPIFSGDRDLLTSALDNVVRNAVEALRSGGAVVVRTSCETSDVIVAIEDDGVGMDEPTRERAFEDFFTTKPTGSGLGLAFVRRVVQAHEGEVSLTS